MTQTIDQWAADACGVEFPDYLDDGWCIYEDTVILWTIKDPRCREIVREHFRLSTIYRYWVMPTEMVYESTTRNGIKYEGKTIAEAESACIQAIYEASQ